MNITVLEEETIILHQFNTELAQMRLGNTVLMILFLVIGIIGNTVVFLIYFLKLKKSEDRYFIPFLAIFDLLACIIGTSFSVLANERPVKFQSDVLCKSLHFFLWYFNGVSNFLLFVISVQRYLKVCKPHGYQMTIGIRRISILVIIFLSCVISLPSLVLVDVIENIASYQNIKIRTYICGYNSENDTWKVVYSLVALFVVISNIVVTVVLYALIGKTLYRRFASLKKIKQEDRSKFTASVGSNATMCEQKSERGNESMSTSIMSPSLSNGTTIMKSPSYFRREETIMQKERNTIRRNVRHNFTYMFMMIVAIYVLSYIPLCLLIIFPLKDRSTFSLNMRGVKLNVYLFFRRIFILNHLVNPFIYGYFDVTFRRIIKEWFLKLKRSLSCSKDSSP